MAKSTRTIGTGERTVAKGLIDNLHRNGIAFTLSPVQEMGYRSLSEKTAVFNYAVDNAVSCLDPPA